MLETPSGGSMASSTRARESRTVWWLYKRGTRAYGLHTDLFRSKYPALLSSLDFGRSHSLPQSGQSAPSRHIHLLLGV